MHTHTCAHSAFTTDVHAWPKPVRHNRIDTACTNCTNINTRASAMRQRTCKPLARDAPPHPQQSHHISSPLSVRKQYQLLTCVRACEPLDSPRLASPRLDSTLDSGTHSTPGFARAHAFNFASVGRSNQTRASLPAPFMRQFLRVVCGWDGRSGTVGGFSGTAHGAGCIYQTGGNIVRMLET